MNAYCYDKAIESATKHKFLHQYTSFEALYKIICCKSLRFTRVDLLNDSVENDAQAKLWKKKVYVSCFTHLEHESPFFWATYVKKIHEGVIISLPREHLCDMTIHADEACLDPPLNPCKNTDPTASYSSVISAKNWGVFDYSCLDIAYLPRNIPLGVDLFSQGRLKYIEWSLEHETRLRIALRPKCTEYKRQGTSFVYHTPENKYIYLHLSGEILNNMTITLSPCGDDGLQKKVEQL